jgi:hypothetical protein
MSVMAVITITVARMPFIYAVFLVTMNMTMT